MADSSLSGVILGGVIGIVGGLIGPLVLEWRKQVAEKKKRKGEKLEELASAFSDYQHWLREITVSAQHSPDTWEAIITKSPPLSYSKMEAISIVYFPELRNLVRSFKDISSEYMRQLGHDKEQATKIIAECKEAAKHLERGIIDCAERGFPLDKNN